MVKSEKGQGIGTGLIQKAIEWAENSNLKGLALETQDNNLLACRFYAKCGFVIGAVNTMFYRNFNNEFAVICIYYFEEYSTSNFVRWYMLLNTEFLKDNEIQLILEKTVDGDEMKNWVPAYYFFICDLHGNRMGKCDLRIGYNDNLYYGGHIGYTVFPEYRGNHYAGKACLLLFRLAKKHDMKYLYITCNPDNYASRKTCEYAKGKLMDTVELPEGNDMRDRGESEKCIYKFILSGE